MYYTPHSSGFAIHDLEQAELRYPPVDLRQRSLTIQCVMLNLKYPYKLTDFGVSIINYFDLFNLRCICPLSILNSLRCVCISFNHFE